MKTKAVAKGKKTLSMTWGAITTRAYHAGLRKARSEGKSEEQCYIEVRIVVRVFIKSVHFAGNLIHPANDFLHFFKSTLKKCYFPSAACLRAVCLRDAGRMIVLVLEIEENSDVRG